MNAISHSEVSQAVSYKQLKVASTAFSDGDLLPPRYTCDGANVNPPLDIADIPADAKSLVIIMTGTYDGKEEWAHWLTWNIPLVQHIAEGRHMEIEGLNYFGMKQYEGPCPTGGLHRYQFKVYALKEYLHLHSYAAKKDLEQAIAGLILAFGSITCYYQRHNNRV